MSVTTKPLVKGMASGPLLRLNEPLSFWGGVDPASGIVIDAQSDGFGKCIAGTVLALSSLRGSSSSSSVLLELIHAGQAPAALILNEADAILIAGVLAARELGWAYPPLLELCVAMQGGLREGKLSITENGVIDAA